MSLDPQCLEPSHFLWKFADGVGTITLNRPDRKNPLTFDSYAELRDLFFELEHTPEVRVIVLTGAGGNFCSGGDVHEIIGPLTRMDDSGLAEFTRMTGDLVRAMRACPQPIIAAVEGVCAGAGAILAMASDLRLASPDDYWLHALGCAGAHVVLRAEPGEKEPPGRSLEEAARLAAWFSDARHEAVADVQWTRRKHVRRPRSTPAGTVLVKKHRTVRVRPTPPA